MSRKIFMLLLSMAASFFATLSAGCEEKIAVDKEIISEKETAEEKGIPEKKETDAENGTVELEEIRERLDEANNLYHDIIYKRMSADMDNPYTQDKDMYMKR